jgi:hypothetical protein
VVASLVNNFLVVLLPAAPAGSPSKACVADRVLPVVPRASSCRQTRLPDLGPLGTRPRAQPRTTRLTRQRTTPTPSATPRGLTPHQEGRSCAHAPPPLTLSVPPLHPRCVRGSASPPFCSGCLLCGCCQSACRLGSDPTQKKGGQILAKRPKW